MHRNPCLRSPPSLLFTSLPIRLLPLSRITFLLAYRENRSHWKQRPELRIPTAGVLLHPGTRSRPHLTQGSVLSSTPRDQVPSSSHPGIGSVLHTQGPVPSSSHPGTGPVPCTQGPGSMLLCTQVQVPSSTPRYRSRPAPDADPAALTHTVTCRT